jgi:hypothetical protein
MVWCDRPLSGRSPTQCPKILAIIDFVVDIGFKSLIFAGENEDTRRGKELQTFVSGFL